MKKLFGLIGLMCCASSAFAGSSQDVPRIVTVNITNFTVNVPFVSFKYAYDESCPQVSDVYSCGGHENIDSTTGIPASVFLQTIALFQNMTFVANANEFTDGITPYLTLGYSLTFSGPSFYPATCSVPMTQSGNYSVEINQTGCQITPVG